MRKMLTLAVLICAANYLSSQISWKPEWKKDKVETVEYNYSKRQFESQELKSRDSVHATINIRFVSENESFYFLEWTFASYFADTTKAENQSAAMVYEVVKRITAVTPIKVRMEKGDFEIKITNKEYLDSLKTKYIKDVAAIFPKSKENSDFDPSMMLGMLVTLQIEAKLYGLINDYYSIYGMKDLKLNVKQDLAAKNADSKEAMANLFGSVDGFSIFEDTDPRFYKFSYQTKLDFSKMAASLSKMGEAYGADDKKSKKKKQTTPDNSAELSKSGGGTSQTINVTKADMLVSSLYYLSDLNIAMMGTENHEIEMKSFRKIN